jgi:hypothetical protein
MLKFSHRCCEKSDDTVIRLFPGSSPSLASSLSMMLTMVAKGSASVVVTCSSSLMVILV